MSTIPPIIPEALSAAPVSRPFLRERLARQLTDAVADEVRFDHFSRGLHATDASIYQIMPAGAVLPKTDADVEATLAIAREHNIGLEPSCLFTLRDEFVALLPGPQSAVVAKCAVLFEEFLAKEIELGRFGAQLHALPEAQAMLHGHCHQKAFGAMPSVTRVLGAIPRLNVSTIDSSCCGMAGTFG